MKHSIQYMIQAATVMLLCVSLVSADGTEQKPFTVAEYVAMDLHVRQHTIDGVKDRLILLELSADTDTQSVHDSDTRQQVDAVYQQYGMTSSSALVWANQHAKAIAQWRVDNPDQQAEYNRMASELEQLSRQIQALVEPSQGDK